MKLHDLTEGLIKIPHTMLAPVWDWVLRETIHQCMTVLKHQATEAEELGITTMLDKLLADKKLSSGTGSLDEYSPHLLHAAKSAKTFPVEVAERYLAIYRAKRGNREAGSLLKKSIDVIVAFKPYKGLDSSSYGVIINHGKAIVLQTEPCSMTAAKILELYRADKATALMMLTRIAIIYKSTLEHELSHLYQYLVFGDLHVKQNLAYKLADEPGQSASNEELQRKYYYLSPNEFDPLIKSAAGIMHAKLHGVTSIVRTKMIEKFTCADLTQAQAKELDERVTPERYGFFIALKGHSQTKWEKAVKLFTQRLAMYK